MFGKILDIILDPSNIIVFFPAYAILFSVLFFIVVVLLLYLGGVKAFLSEKLKDWFKRLYKKP